MKSGFSGWWRRWLRRLARLGGFAILAGLAVVAYANFAPVWQSRGCLFDQVQDVPFQDVGLVFGCDPKIDGRDNLYFRYRMDAAAALWKAGKVGRLIVSGDNRAKYYNEPGAMRQALVARGVPDDRIVSDFLGLRTLDSVVRAKEVFGVTRITFITQRFQNERAIYLAKANGMEADGFNAQDIVGSGGDRTRLREVGARVKMWLDVQILHTRPRHPVGKLEVPIK